LPKSVELTLYIREGCHLCDAMLQELRDLQRRLHFRLRLADIDADAALRRRYDEWVPVLCHERTEICHYQLDEPVLRDYLSRGPNLSGSRHLPDPR
jgi:thioredoxin reductase (NADPH)